MDKVVSIDQQEKIFSKIEKQIENMNLSELWKLLDSTENSHDNFREQFGYDFTKELNHLLQMNSIRKEIRSRA